MSDSKVAKLSISCAQFSNDAIEVKDKQVLVCHAGSSFKEQSSWAKRLSWCSRGKLLLSVSLLIELNLSPGQLHLVMWAIPPRTSILLLYYTFLRLWGRHNSSFLGDTVLICDTYQAIARKLLPFQLALHQLRRCDIEGCQGGWHWATVLTFVCPTILDLISWNEEAVHDLTIWGNELPATSLIRIGEKNLLLTVTRCGV